MRAVITGATGAVGMALISELISRNIEVLVLLRQGSRNADAIPETPLVKKLTCPLDRISELFIGGERYDAFFHLGWAGTVADARDDVALQLKNAVYTIDAVELAARLGCSVFIGAGSQAEYGKATTPLTESTPTFPQTAYGIAKLCAGQMSALACKRLGIRHVWGRILSVYGPYESKNSLISYAINQLLDGKATEFTACEQTWDFLYSADAARALVSLALCQSAEGVYCLASGSSRPLGEYIKIIGEMIDREAVLGFGEIPYSKEQVMYLAASIDKLVRDTGYKPETSFEEGIAHTIRFYRGASGR